VKAGSIKKEVRTRGLRCKGAGQQRGPKTREKGDKPAIKTNKGRQEATEKKKRTLEKDNIGKP